MDDSERLLREATVDELVNGICRLTHRIHGIECCEEHKDEVRMQRNRIREEIRRRIEQPLAAVGEPLEVSARHHPGRDTEVLAAQLVMPRAGTLREKALEAFRYSPEGLTDEELASFTNEYRYTMAPRRGELARLGWVEDSGERRMGSRGRPQVVWRLTEDAVRLLSPVGARQ